MKASEQSSASLKQQSAACMGNPAQATSTIGVTGAGATRVGIQVLPPSLAPAARLQGRARRGDGDVAPTRPTEGGHHFGNGARAYAQGVQPAESVPVELPGVDGRGPNGG